MMTDSFIDSRIRCSKELIQKIEANRNDPEEMRTLAMQLKWMVEDLNTAVKPEEPVNQDAVY